jgi:excisionase family DNA binding protein
MPNEVMTIEEAASFLRVSKNTVYGYVRRGIIPARKIGKVWRLSRVALEAWLSEGEADEVTPELTAFIAESERDVVDGRTITTEEYAKKRGIVL